MDILTGLKSVVKTHRSDIILGVGVFLLSLLSFGIGYMTAREQLKEPLRIEQQLYE
ncbi:MAG: hypothetical protein Q7R48_02710 [bacterium]|nr:hypothetical protein [bacterium]